MKRAILRLTAEDFGRSSLNLGRADENIPCGWKLT